MQALYDDSLLFCPNTGLMFEPADYRYTLDAFYQACKAKKRNLKSEPKGRLLTQEQWIMGDRALKKKLNKGRINTDEELQSDPDQGYFITYNDKYVGILKSALLRCLW